MKMAIYALWDRLAEEAGPIWTARNDAVAIRNALIASKGQDVNQQDFFLYCIGEYDTEKVRLTEFEPRQVPMIQEEIKSDA